MTAHLAITLDDDQKARLDALAQVRKASVSEVAAEAVAQYLDDDAAFRAAVVAGLTAGRAGDVGDFSEFAADLRLRMTVRIAESEG